MSCHQSKNMRYAFNKCCIFGSAESSFFSSWLLLWVTMMKLEDEKLGKRKMNRSQSIASLKVLSFFSLLHWFSQEFFFSGESSHLRRLSKTLVRSYDFRVSEPALFDFLVVHREYPVLPTMHFRM